MDWLPTHALAVNLFPLNFATVHVESDFEYPFGVSLLTMKPVAIDLYSGCGGLTRGLKKAGFRVIGAVENHHLSVRTYRANHPEVHVWSRNIRWLSAPEVARKLRLRPGQLDLLAGCPPCQAFSTLPSRNGGRRIRDKERKDLVLQFIRFVRWLQPKVVMMENVPRLARDPRMRHLRRFLKRMGYKCESEILDASKYGVPQRRRRMLLLASRIGPIEFARPARISPTVWTAIGRLRAPRHSRDKLHQPNLRRSERIKALIGRIPLNGGGRLSLGYESQLKCHKKCNGFKDVYGRMAWKDVAPTITSGCLNPSKGRFLHPRQHRPITLREAALLQTFPRRYWFPLDNGRYAVAAMIGNAFPPEFVRRHALRVKNRLLAVSSKG